ncbi:MAG: phage portal protein [Clostridia bacterium]|nr:phage portal protein [Clostridia bacterium]NDO20343.1 phage portal protein [Lachnospiraceae bacterium MD329]
MINIANRIKGAFFALTHDTETISLNDPRFWRMYGNVKNSKLSEITYFTCLKTLSEAVAKLPLKMYRETDKGIQKARDKPLYNTLKLRPNRNMTATSFWATVVMIMYHYGNCFVYPLYKGNKAPELIILDSRYMRIFDDNAKILSKNGGVWYVYSEPKTGKIYKFSVDEILHFKTYMTFDGISGLAVKDILELTIDGALNSQNFIQNLYKNGLTGRIAVEYTQDLNGKLANQAIKTFEAAVDADKAMNFIPIPNGMKLNPLNLKLTDAQFLEMKKYTALQIAGAFGIKPNQINDYEKSSYANSEAQQQAFLTDTLLVILKGLEEELTSKLFTAEEIQQGYFFKFNVDVILRATFTQRMAGYAQARQNGWLCANDILEKEDMPYISAEEGGFAYLVNGNMISLKQAMNGGDKNVKE